MGVETSILDFGADPTGGSDCSAALTSACAALRFGGILRFPSGDYRFSKNVCSGAGIVPCFDGALLHIDNGVTLTFNQAFQAPAIQLFAFAMDPSAPPIVFGSGGVPEKIFPEWFGFKWDGNVASAMQNLSALNQAAASIGTVGGTVGLNPGLAYINSTWIILNQNINIKGSGGPGDMGGNPQVVTGAKSIIACLSTTDPIIEFTQSTWTTASFCSLEDFAVFGTNLAEIDYAPTSGTVQTISHNNAHGIVIDAMSNVLMKNVGIFAPQGHGLFISNCTMGRFDCVRVNGAAGDGLHTDGNFSISSYGGYIFNNTFVNFSAVGCGGSGICFVDFTRENVFLGGDSEQNCGYAIDIQAAGNYPSQCNRFYAFHQEVCGSTVYCRPGSCWNYIHFSNSDDPDVHGFANGDPAPAGISNVVDGLTNLTYHQQTIPPSVNCIEQQVSLALVRTKVAIAGTGSYALDAGASSFYDLTIAGGDTLTLSAIAQSGRDGQFLTVVITQGTGGNALVSWSADFNWAGSSTPLLHTAAGAKDVFTFFYDTVNAVWWEISRSKGT